MLFIQHKDLSFSSKSADPFPQKLPWLKEQRECLGVCFLFASLANYVTRFTVVSTHLKTMFGQIGSSLQVEVLKNKNIYIYIHIVLYIHIFETSPPCQTNTNKVLLTKILPEKPHQLLLKENCARLLPGPLQPVNPGFSPPKSSSLVAPGSMQEFQGGHVALFSRPRSLQSWKSATWRMGPQLRKYLGNPPPEFISHEKAWLNNDS